MYELVCNTVHKHSLNPNLKTVETKLNLAK